LKSDEVQASVGSNPTFSVYYFFLFLSIKQSRIWHFATLMLTSLLYLA